MSDDTMMPTSMSALKNIMKSVVKWWTRGELNPILIFSYSCEFARNLSIAQTNTPISSLAAIDSFSPVYTRRDDTVMTLFPKPITPAPGYGGGVA